jgi:acetoacetyl-CoA synthetase
MAGLPLLVQEDIPLPLYEPPNPGATATFRFLARVNATLGLSLTSYQDLYSWSTTHLDDFWSAVWDETKIIGHKGSHIVENKTLPPVNPPWYASLSPIRTTLTGLWQVL